MAAFENPSRARSTINPAEIRKRRLKSPSKLSQRPTPSRAETLPPEKEGLVSS